MIHKNLGKTWLKAGRENLSRLKFSGKPTCCSFANSQLRMSIANLEGTHYF